MKREQVKGAVSKLTFQMIDNCKTCYFIKALESLRFIRYMPPVIHMLFVKFIHLRRLRGSISSATQAIGRKAINAGFNVIKFPSIRGPGINFGVLSNFDNLLIPRMIVPTP